MAEAALMHRVESEPAPSPALLTRVRSVDVVRGLVCVLMAIDHVRVYSGIPAGGPTPGVFLTRWVTHFVAPAFCFFAGTAAFFLGRRLKDTGALRRFLISRGLLLVVLELTLIRFLWSFNPNLTQFSLAGVIWMLGWCMVLLGLFVGMKPRTIGWIGVGIVLLQQVLALPPRAPGMGAIAPVWAFLYPSGAEAPLGINVLYVIVPWIGVMMAGYGFGLFWDRDEPSRDRLFVRLGLGMTFAWIVGATIFALVAGGGGGEAGGDGPRPPLWMQVLNQQKYPASQLFLLMTLGPAIALLPWAEKAHGWAGKALDTFGRVPMWYYLMHLLVIHVAALVAMFIRTGAYQNGWYLTAPYAQVPQEARWPLAMLYLTWAICIVVLFPLCRWYEERKRTRPAPWMRYI
jgi:uncharacterized membrane protein